jgi:glycosyltransferase involved in cell wall biosynthesis
MPARAPEQQLSCVIPAWRAAATIARAVSSCLSDPAIGEVIVVVDGPDPSLEAAVPRHARVKTIVKPENNGAAAARNTGLDAASHPTVLFLDADDYIAAPHAAGLVDALASNGADVALAPFRFEWEATGRSLAGHDYGPGAIDSLALMQRWLLQEFVPPCSVGWRTDSLRRIGGWDASISRNDDGELIYRAIFRGLRFAGSRSGMGCYVQHQAGARLSRRSDSEGFRSESTVLERVEAGLADPGLATARPQLAEAWYILARAAYRAGHAGIGNAALANARRLGFRGHAGSIAHRLSASLVGLRAKEAIATRFAAADVGRKE